MQKAKTIEKDRKALDEGASEIRLIVKSLELSTQEP